MSVISKIASSVGLAVMLSAHAVVADEKFTAADVLSWDQESQNWYFTVNASMAGALASQNDSPAASCIDEWYFDAADRATRNDEFRSAMRRFEEYHPTLVVIAVIEKACGELKF